MIIESLPFRLLLFLSMLFFVALIFYQSASKKRYDDPLLELKIVDKEKQQEFGTFAAKVTVGLLIKNFVVFDIVKNNFIADLNLWFEYNSDQLMLDTISQFSFDNGEILKKSSPEVKFKNNKVSVEFDVRVSFKSNMAYQRFPLEAHRISLVLSNNFITPSEMFFAAEDAGFKVDPTVFIADWNIVDLSTDVGFLEVVLDQATNKSTANPKARFTINLQKKGLKDAFVIFVPLYLASSIGVSSFLTSLTNSTIRSHMASSVVPALLGYRFVIQNMLPQVAYFTVTDYIYLLLLLIGFFVFIFQTILIRIVSATVKDGLTKQATQVVLFFNRLSLVTYILLVFLIILGTYFFVS